MSHGKIPHCRKFISQINSVGFRNSPLSSLSLSPWCRIEKPDLLLPGERRGICLVRHPSNDLYKSSCRLHGLPAVHSSRTQQSRTRPQICQSAVMSSGVQSHSLSFETLVLVKILHTTYRFYKGVMGNDYVEACAIKIVSTKRLLISDRIWKPKNVISECDYIGIKISASIFPQKCQTESVWQVWEGSSYIAITLGARLCEFVMNTSPFMKPWLQPSTTECFFVGEWDCNTSNQNLAAHAQRTLLVVRKKRMSNARSHHCSSPSYLR